MLMALFTFAQFQKGNKVLGLGLGFSSSKSQNENNQSAPVNTNNSYNSSFELGFAAKENKLHGFFAGFGFGKNKSESTQPFNLSENQTRFYNAGYFTRMYKSLGKSFFVFGDIRGGYTYIQNINKNVNNFTTNENKQQIHSVNVSFFPGVAYKWTSRFLLEVRTGDIIAIGYSRSINTNNINNEKIIGNNFSVNTSLGLGFLQNFGIGARWIIGQNKKS